MLWLYFCVVIISCSNVISKSRTGLYIVKLSHLEECDDVGTGDVRLSLRMKRLNRTSLAADFNLTLNIPYDDRIQIRFSVATFTNGGYRENFFNYNIPKGCTHPLKFSPVIFKELLSALNVEECPIPKGNYTVYNFNPKEELGKYLAMFVNNKYRASTTFFRNNKLRGGFFSYLELVSVRTRS